MEQAVDVLTWIGLLISLSLHLRQWRHDRPKLRLSITGEYPDAADDAETTGDVGMRYIRVTAVNVGWRPVTVERIGLKLEPELRFFPAGLRPKAQHVYLPMPQGIDKRLGQSDAAYGEEVEDAILWKMLFRPDGPYRIDGVVAVDTSRDTHRADVSRAWRQLGRDHYGTAGTPEWKPTRSLLSTVALTLWLDLVRARQRLWQRFLDW